MSQEAPNINSTRILRAYRLNNVETAKLRNTLFILDKSKKREMRIANQDIRLINLTLDYINSSSGHSPEGLHPDYVDTRKREESTPMFMYGERLVSRKFGKKFRRVQSAHGGLGRQNSEEDLTNQESEANDKGEERKVERPKSSPAKPHTTFTGLSRSGSMRQKSEKPGGGTAKKQGTGRRVQRSSSLKYPNEETPESEPVTAVAIETARELTAQNAAKNSEDGITNAENALKGNSAENTLQTANGLNLPQNGAKREESKVPPIYLTEENGTPSPEGMKGSVYTPIIRHPKSRPRSRNQDRKQEMTRKVKEAREQVLNARKTKPDPMQAWALPASNPQKQQAVIDFKKNLNQDKNQMVQDRLKDFMHLYPVKKY